MIKAILFDHFGVLVDPVYTSLLGNLPDQTVKAILSINDAADRGEITNIERDKQIAPFLEDGKTSIDAARTKARRNDALLTFILELRRSYKIGMLSNAANGLVESFFTSDDMKMYFDDVVLSYEVHMIKPHREIYLLAAERLGVMPNECIFIDDVKRNIIGAEAAGMHGVIYKNLPTLKLDLDNIIEDEHARVARG